MQEATKNLIVLLPLINNIKNLTNSLLIKIILYYIHILKV
jgi:hypothetical protein